MNKSLISKLVLSTLLLLTGVTSVVQANSLCPFCSAINLTFAEQMRKNDVVVIAKVVNIPPPIDDVDAELPRSQFEVTQVLKGNEFVGPGMKFETLLVGNYDLGQEFLVMGADPPAVVWTTPMKANQRVVDYIAQINLLPEDGPERLVFFQKYFEDEQSVLAYDAYDEFAQAPYKDLLALKDQMERDKLVAWILDPETAINRRRLYFVMLGVCGGEKDIEILEELIKSGDRKKQAGLDALLACYLNLKKEDGVDLVEQEFITKKDCDYVDTLAAVSALRFHGTEVDFIPRERIVRAIRHLLDRPKMADMIIPDLARWEDWTVVDKLVQMFKDADDETNWLRVPVINYLRACPDPEAKKHIEKLREIDPDAVRRAEFFANFDDEDDEEPEDENEDSDESSESQSGSEQNGSNGESDAESGLQSSDGDDLLSSEGTVQVTTPVLGDAPQEVKLLKVPVDLESAEDTQQVSASDSGVRPIPSEFTTPVNSEMVSSVSNTTAAPTLPAETAQVAPQPLEVAPVADTSMLYTDSTWLLVGVPMMFSGMIFVLLWSVINGWFQRLIF